MGEKETSSQPVPQSQSKKNISCCPPPPCHFYCLFKIKDSAGWQFEELRDHQHQQVSLTTVWTLDTEGQGQINQVGCC